MGGPLRLVTVGHVDHGKSTLVGRLLVETGSIAPERLAAVAAHCAAKGQPIELAFLLDALAEEREQGVTIDVAQVHLKTPAGRFVVFDAPGHQQFVRNAVCGVAAADVAVLLLDAAAGVGPETRKHARLARFLGISRLIVVLNKMDLVGWSEERYRELRSEISVFLAQISLEPSAVIPISARDGEGVTRSSTLAPWYDGPNVLAALESVSLDEQSRTGTLRYSVHGVYKFDDRRIVAGRVESGSLTVGARLLFLPSHGESTVRSIERFPADGRDRPAGAGECVGITLEDSIFLERGELAGAVEGVLPVVTDVLRARVLWLGEEPLEAGRRLLLRLLTQQTTCEVESVESVVEARSLESHPASAVPTNEIGEVTLRLERAIALDGESVCRTSGRFVLVVGHVVAGGGTLEGLHYPDQRPARHPEVASRNIQWEGGLVSRDERAVRDGHRGAVIWLTGLSGAGKSTVARLLERRLFELSVRAYRLDGDNIRHGLNANLGFTPDDRAENIRRVAEVANLFADAGIVVITSFISPYRSDRKRAREIVHAAPFVEVFVDSSLATCERRDPKGLYDKARRGLIREFTGISAPYEKPLDPDIHLDTESADPEACVEALLASLRRSGVVPVATVVRDS